MSVSPFLLPKLPTLGQPLPWRGFGALEHKSIALLSKLDGMMMASTKADLFWITWLMKEAQLSNVIEGTVTTFDEVMGEHAGIVVPVERKADVQEVLNYREAMLDGLNEIHNGRHLSLSLIKALHARLLHGTRGANKMPGDFRKVQVHIGRPGSSLETATYVPPSPVRISELLENWIQFFARNDLNPLIQTAVIHAQFEMIHPFLDGNGRMGRLLITLFLADKSILTKPCFYMSSYLQSHRDRYYQTLNHISKDGNWNDWIEFFLNGVIEHCENNMNRLIRTTNLYEKSKNEFALATNSSCAIDVLDYVFAHPIFSIPDLLLKSKQHIPVQTASQVIGKLTAAGLIDKLAAGRGRIPAVYRFTELMSLLS